MEEHSPKNDFLSSLRPSFIGGLLSILIGVIAVAVIMTPLFYENSGIRFYIDYIAAHPDQTTMQIQSASEGINSSPLLANISVFIFWALTGIIGYLIISGLRQLVKDSVEALEEIENAPVDKKSVRREVLERLLLRSGIVVAIFGYYLLLIKFIIPTIIVFSQSALHSSAVTGTLIAAESVAMVALAVHVLVVLTRLFLARTRIFFS